MAQEEPPRFIAQHGVLITGVCGVLGTLCLFAGGASPAGLGLGGVAYWVGVLVFIEARRGGNGAGVGALGESLQDSIRAGFEAGGRVIASREEGPSSEPEAEAVAASSRAHRPLLLHNARLDGARLDGMDLRDASLTKLSAVGADFRQATLRGADLGESNLRDANFSGCELHDVTMSKSVLDGANLARVTAHKLKLDGARLFDARLSRGEFALIELRDVKASGLDMSSVTIEQGVLVGAMIERADCRNATWRAVDITRSRWLKSKLMALQAFDLVGRGVQVIECNLEGSMLKGADLREAALIECEMARADLSYAILDGANLSRTDLSEADLSEASMKGVKLEGANLSGADLSGANLSDTDLSQCIHNMLTTWPDGVRPEQLTTTLDEASLSEMVEEMTGEVPRDEPTRAKAPKAARPKIDLKGVTLRKPSRKVEKTVPLNDQDLQILQDLAPPPAKEHSTPPPIMATSEKAGGEEEGAAQEQLEGEPETKEGREGVFEEE